MRKFLPAFIGVLLIAMTASAPAEDHFISMASGLLYHDELVGSGPEPQSGQTVIVHYTGWLYEMGKRGKKFDSSRDRGAPFTFVLNGHQVIQGWDQGVATMHIGGKRTLIIPPELGYGARGAGGVIPPNATLIFDIELLGVR
jgi:peptidylprolyl isomerase